jgi:hypothetical protein
MSLLHCFSCRRSLAWTLSNPSPILGHHIILGTVDVLLHSAHQSHIQLCQNVGLQHDNTASLLYRFILRLVSSDAEE